MYIIEILNSRNKCWIASWEGDPPRTLKIENAQVFNNENEAEDRILEVRKTHPLKEMSYEILTTN